ncbi:MULTISPECIES: DapH/DapD/GlmU-related protein [Aeromicrobium]|uniref:acyltransferase n=1 Tax=Aeromicrobium TaxID=2040 RepID=UPI0006F32192|nr:MULTISPECIES: acyltransferase [Aeromicrobium]KQX74268.1 hypothetical protein ASD10_03200 [Aeromicrobium sp. Root472D3]MCL8249805.1 acyltransferase [Aeromicrobium fastidiosum]
MRNLFLLLATMLRLFRQRTASETERIAYYPDVEHGRDVRLTGDVNFGSEPFLVSLGSRVTIADGVRFITHDGAVRVLRDELPDLHLYGPIKVGDDVFIGVSAIIMPNVSIGNRSIIGAGSVVTRSVPAGEVWAGVPARRIRTIDEYRASAIRESFRWEPGDYGPRWREELVKRFGQ